MSVIKVQTETDKAAEYLRACVVECVKHAITSGEISKYLILRETAVLAIKAYRTASGLSVKGTGNFVKTIVKDILATPETPTLSDRFQELELRVTALENRRCAP